VADFTLGPADVISAGYTGAAKTYEVTFNGYIEIKAWGAGGGGGWVHSSIITANYRTGGGGYVDCRIPVAVGDIIKIEVGQGGRRASSVTAGSEGGWPDGGRGTRGTAGAGGDFYRGGGGGGSTRVYKNDALILVAGASGGGCRGFGGAGGGTTGGTGNAGATGGTQQAGGSVGGSFLKGADAPLAPATGSSSGGGGGGYYGGGYDGDATNVAGGGGGSGYLNAQFGQNIQGTNGQTGLAAKNTDPDYVAGVGLGGLTYANAGTTDGGDGRVVMRQNDGSEFALVEEAWTPLTNNAAATQSWVISKNGVVEMDLWGAGGGGGMSSIVGPGPGGYPRGGGGGYTRAKFTVAVGDVLEVKVGRPGRAARADNSSPMGGGWPDGGTAGNNSSGSSQSGSGGGSTQVFVNGTLMAVAGAGGGGSIPTRGDNPGAGGGTTGQNSVDSTDSVNAATGGSQSAGGINPEFPDDTGYHGGYLQGGNGRPAGIAANATDSRCSAGGGGGYYGGGGSGKTGSYFRAGAGGSGYVRPGVIEGSTEGGNLGTPAQIAHTRYPGSNVAYGGQGGGSYGAVNDGNPGYAVYYFEPVTGAFGPIGTVSRAQNVEGAASGGLTFNNTVPVTVAVSAVNGVGDGGTTVDALLGPLEVFLTPPAVVARVNNGWEGPLPGPVTTVAPEGTADTQVNAFGQIGTINILSLLEAGPEQEANVILDLVFEFDGGVFVESLLEAAVTGAAAVPKPPAALLIGEVDVSPVSGFYTSVDQEAPAELDSIVTASPIEGYAAEAFEATLDSTVTATSLLGASATGAAAIAARISFIPENGQGGGVGIGAVNGRPSTPDMQSSGDLGKVAVDPIQGVALSGDDVVLAVGVMPDRVTTEWTNTDAIQARGEGGAFAQLNQGGSNNPADNYLFRVWRNTNINGSAVGSATVTADLSATITFAAPQGVTIRGQSIVAPIGTVFVRRPFAGAGENPAIEGDALAGYDLRDTPILITPPEAGFAINGEAVGQGQLTVVVLPPPVEAAVGQDRPLDIPGPIILTPMEGQAYPVAPESDAQADLSAVVTLLPPEAQPNVSLAVMLPGAVRVSPVLAAFKVVAVSGTAVFIRQVEGEAVFRRVENAVAVVEDRIERTVVFRG